MDFHMEKHVRWKSGRKFRDGGSLDPEIRAKRQLPYASAYMYSVSTFPSNPSTERDGLTGVGIFSAKTEEYSSCLLEKCHIKLAARSLAMRHPGTCSHWW